MVEINFKRRKWTWANNRKGEGFIEERLDLVFGSDVWNMENEKVEVQHLVLHSSDHSMILLDTQPDQPARRSQLSMIKDGQINLDAWRL